MTPARRIQCLRRYAPGAVLGLKELSPEPIDLTLIAQILEAANWAPSHGKTEPWRFVVYSGAARRIVGDAFGAAFRLLNQGAASNEAGERAQRERVWQAPVWIALGMRRMAASRLTSR